MCTFLLNACLDIGFDRESSWKACILYRRYNFNRESPRDAIVLAAGCMWTVSKYTELIHPPDPRLRDIFCAAEYFHQQESGEAVWGWPIPMEIYWEIRDSILAQEQAILIDLKFDLRMPHIDKLEYVMFNQLLGDTAKFDLCVSKLDTMFATGDITVDLDNTVWQFGLKITRDVYGGPLPWERECLPE